MKTFLLFFAAVCVSVLAVGAAGSAVSEYVLPPCNPCRAQSNGEWLDCKSPTACPSTFFNNNCYCSDNTPCIPCNSTASEESADKPLSTPEALPWCPTDYGLCGCNTYLNGTSDCGCCPPPRYGGITWGPDTCLCLNATTSSGPCEWCQIAFTPCGNEFVQPGPHFFQSCAPPGTPTQTSLGCQCSDGSECYQCAPGPYILVTIDGSLTEFFCPKLPVKAYMSPTQFGYFNANCSSTHNLSVGVETMYGNGDFALESWVNNNQMLPGVLSAIPGSTLSWSQDVPGSLAQIDFTVEYIPQ